jgi:hypothetical protein
MGDPFRFGRPQEKTQSKVAQLLGGMLQSSLASKKSQLDAERAIKIQQAKGNIIAPYMQVLAKSQDPKVHFNTALQSASKLSMLGLDREADNLINSARLNYQMANMASKKPDIVYQSNEKEQPVLIGGVPHRKEYAYDVTGDTPIMIQGKQHYKLLPIREIDTLTPAQIKDLTAKRQAEVKAATKLGGDMAKIDKQWTPIFKDGVEIGIRKRLSSTETEDLTYKDNAQEIEAVKKQLMAEKVAIAKQIEQHEEASAEYARQMGQEANPKQYVTTDEEGNEILIEKPKARAKKEQSISDPLGILK